MAFVMEVFVLILKSFLLAIWLTLKLSSSISKYDLMWNQESKCCYKSFCAVRNYCFEFCFLFDRNYKRIKYVSQVVSLLGIVVLFLLSI